MNGGRIRMARVMRGLSSPQLAKLIGVTKQAVWQYENTPVNPVPEVMFKICKELDFPLQFFYEGENESIILGKSYCRTSTSTAKSAKDAQLYYNILRIYLFRYFQKFITFPIAEASQFVGDSNMDSFTMKIREHYGIGNDPISSMPNFLENTGIILATYHHDKDKFDALSQAPVIDGKRYRITVYNLDNTTFARLQFTLGHELGHWLLGHIDSDEDTLSNEEHRENEIEANLFSASLLLPKDAFKRDLTRPADLAQYVDLKRKWKVSVATMIMRARNLELVTYAQYQSLYRQLSKKGWRTSEPYDDLAVVPHPTLLPAAVDLLDQHDVVKKSNLVREFTINCFTANQSLYEELLCLEEHALDPPTLDPPKILFDAF